MVQLSNLYVTTGKTRVLTIWTFVSKVISLLFNMFSRFVIAFLSRRILDPTKKRCPVSKGKEAPTGW